MLKKLMIFVLFSVLVVTSVQTVYAENGVHMIGDIKVIPIQDITMQMNVDFFQSSAENKAKYVPNGVCDAALNVFIVDDGKNVSLIDAGYGASNNGKLLENMLKAGYKPEDIDNIILTHMHPDHVGGATIKNGDMTERVFKNAKVYVPKTEYDYWVTNTLQQGKTNHATNFADAYKGAINTYTGEKPLMNGITPIAAYGHTVGHTMYEISSKGQKMLILGDIFHCLSLQINDTKASIKFDTNPAEAIKTREKVLKKAADENILVGGMHIPNGGVGYIKEKDGKYSFESKK